MALSTIGTNSLADSAVTAAKATGYWCYRWQTHGD